MVVRLNRRRLMGTVAAAVLAGATPLMRSQSARGETAATPGAGTAVPASGKELLLRVEVDGGFVPVEFNLTRIPPISIYTDGTVITTGPVIEIYPAPALPNLRELTLTPAGVARVLALARSAGLDQAAFYEGALVTDLPNTVFTVNFDGAISVVSAYALGFGEETITDPALRAARAKLIEFMDELGALLATPPAEVVASGDRAFAITRLRIFARRIDPANPPDKDLPQPPVNWPLASDLATFGDTDNTSYHASDLRCGVVEGADAKVLVAALQRANALTPWVSNGERYLLWNRPLLPDDPSACR